MYPSKPGLWQLETEVGFNQEKGMQTLFLVLADGNKKLQSIYVLFFLLCCVFLFFLAEHNEFNIYILADCYHPLGLESGSVKDDQITATNTRGRHASTG